MKKLIAYTYIGFILASPGLAFAQNNKTLSDLTALLSVYMQQAIYLIMSAAIVVFVWGIFKYYFIPEADRTEAAKYVLYGTIGFFVMLSFWGFVNIFRNTLNLDETRPNVPFVNTLQFNQGVRGTGGASAPVTGTGGASAGVQGTGGAYIAPEDLRSGTIDGL